MDRFLYRKSMHSRFCRAAVVMMVTAALFSLGGPRHDDAQPVLFSLLFPQLMEGFTWPLTDAVPDLFVPRRGIREVLL